MATIQCTKEAVWLRQLLADVGYVQEWPTSIMCNNQGYIAPAKNPTYHSHTKHINVQHHFIREKLEKTRDIFECCPIEDIIAEVLIKALGIGINHKP